MSKTFPRDKPAFMALRINLLRKGEMRSYTAGDAPEAARMAAKWARDGWLAKVEDRHSGHEKMVCKPAAKRGRVYAVCKAIPTFKRALKR